MRIYVAYIILGNDYEGDKNDYKGSEPIRFMAVGRTPMDATDNLKTEWGKYYLHSKTVINGDLWGITYLNPPDLEPLWEQMVLGVSDTKIVIEEKKFGI